MPDFEHLEEAIGWVADMTIEPEGQPVGYAFLQVLREWLEDEKEDGPTPFTAERLSMAIGFALEHPDEGDPPEEEGGGDSPPRPALRPVGEPRPFRVKLSATTFHYVEVQAASRIEARERAGEMVAQRNFATFEESQHDEPVNWKVIDVLESQPTD